MTQQDNQALFDAQSELKRCISRLSFIGMGLSNSLDKELKLLRETIKADEPVEQIKLHIDNISQILRVIEEDEESEPASQKVEVAFTPKDFSDILNDKPLPLEFKKALSESQIKLESDEAVKITRTILDAILTYLQNLPEPETSHDKQGEQQSAGFWRNLFQNKKVENKESSSDGKERQNSAERKNSELNVPEELRISLQRLIEQLSAIAHYQEIARQLTSKVVGLNSVADLADILETLTGAFISIANHEHQQLERFLRSLDKRIEQVNGFILHSAEFSEQVTQDSRQLDDDLKDQVSDIKLSFEGSTELSQVKESVYRKMDAILEKVNRFYIEQKEKQAQLDEGIQSLNEQLKATEDESSRLKEEFAAQRIRAQTDQLTQLPNRYSYNERLTQEYNRWRRYRSPLGLVVCDIDYFKKINDEFGHIAGDEMLKSVSNYLRSELRESDFVARFGGEEFVILLPETSLVHATKAMNKLRLGIKELVVNFEGHQLQTTMSFGIAEFDNSDTPKAVFARADTALYRAKQKGRDQVCCQRVKSESN